MQDIQAIYTTRYQEFTKQYEILRKKCNLITYSRLTYFLVGMGIAFYIFNGYGIVGFYFLIPFLIIFALVVKWHDTIKVKRDYFYNLTLINQQEIDGLNYKCQDWVTGEEFASFQHPYTSDLDIFGQGSIFQYLNRTISTIGTQTLANWLQIPTTKETIEHRQAAIGELAQQLDWRQDLQALGMNIEETKKDVPEILSWLKEPFFIINNRLLTTLLFILPMAFGGTFLAFLFGWVAGIVPITFYIINLAVIKFVEPKVSKTITQTAQRAKLLNIYQQLFAHVEKVQASTTHLQQLQKQLLTDNKKASEQIQRLSSLSANLHIRGNLLAFLVFNTGFLWELIFCRKLELWKRDMQGNMETWFTALGEFEALTSLANLSFNQPTWTTPIINDQYFQLKGQTIGHPLLPPQQRICNDIAIPQSPKILLITGSNMAGKSTFLRTVGVNIVLAMTGAVVCAKQFETSIATIYSSMRNKDSLQDSTSSFFAELKGLKKTIDVVAKQEQPIFFLLDEILKGTNSKDRHTGSVALIKQLIESNGVGIIATHDLALCYLEEALNYQVENWCFEVEITEKDMIFDYTKKKGVCQSMNATTLMKQMGIKID